MPDAQSTWVVLAIGILGGGGVAVALINGFFSRNKVRGDTDTASVAASKVALDIVTTALEQQNARVKREMDEMRTRLDRAERAAKTSEERADKAEMQGHRLAEKLARFERRVKQLETALRDARIDVPPWPAGDHGR